MLPHATFHSFPAHFERAEPKKHTGSSYEACWYQAGILSLRADGHMALSFCPVREGVNGVTLMRVMPLAVRDTQLAISSQSLRMNWCGTTNTSRSASLAASRSSGTATWRGQERRVWARGN